MSAIYALISIIYHEKQQPGSMLCAQHALNSLLQGNYYSAPDLSQIASSLDALEESYDDANQGRTSTNMDDTGFFSVQVIEQALQVWGLHTVRWRSEEMREYQDHPENQLAFILNLEQHWFTLRRFGELTSHTHTSTASNQIGSQWFNLNSFLVKPELVSKTYLGMVLQQAESEGYSVFAIVQTDPQGPVSLPHTRADEVASTLPEPTSYGGTPRLSTTHEHQASADASHIQGFEDEDMELQAALQASLGGLPADFVLPPRAAPLLQFPPEINESTRLQGEPIPPIPLPPASGFPHQQGRNIDLDDPVAASMARNRMIMEQMKREQEMALREQYEEEAARFGSASASSARHGDDEDMLRRAIEESQTFSDARTNPSRDRNAEEEEMETDDDDDDYHPAPALLDPLPTDLQPLPPLAGPDGRVLDDEDAELQAALRASLQSVPEGFVIPDSPPRPSAPPVFAPPVTMVGRYTQDSDVGSDADTSTSTEVSQAGRGSEENVSVDELRKRRLAKFGGT